ncbi:MAG: TonB-dependent receptor, partial [Deltaproteobacteria bacterium]|nr:TonB-dependent receptor [Deltaproteobacteria bacterium]
GAEGKGHQFLLRGFDAAHGADLEVTVDGVPVNDVSNVHGQGYVDLGFLPADVVQEMVVLKGPFALEQGDFATAGSLALRLGAVERGSRLTYEAGTTNRHRLLLVEAPAAWRTGFLAIEALTDDGFGDDRSSRHLGAVAKVPLGQGGAGPTLLLAAHKAWFGSPTALREIDVEAGRIGEVGSYVHGLQGQSGRLVASLAAPLHGRAGALDLAAGFMLRAFELESDYTGFVLYPDQGDARRQRHEALVGFASAWWQRRVRLAGRAVTLRAGLTWRGDFFDQDEGQIRGSGELPWLVTRDARGQVQHGAAAVGAALDLARWLAVEVGARVDLFGIVLADRLQDGREYRDLLAAVSPRATLRLPVTRPLSLFLAYGRGLRSPEARAIATRDLPAEDVAVARYRGGAPAVATADALEAGARLAPGPRLEITAAAFATFMSNETVFDHVSGTNLELNATRRRGGELGLRVRPAPWLEIRADGTAVDARFVESGHPVPGAPRFLLTCGAAAVHPAGLRAGVSGYYLAPRPLAHGAVGAHGGALDLTAAYRRGRFEIRLEVENVTAARRREGEYHFASWFDRAEPRSLLPVTHATPGPPLTARLALTLFL